MSDSDSDDGQNGMPFPGEMDMGDMDDGQVMTEEHVWMGTLKKDKQVLRFEGLDEAECTLILKRATLTEDCEDEKRQVVSLITLDHSDTRIDGILCSLNLNTACSVSLGDLNVSPPCAFKLVKGEGPISIVANLIKQIDPSLVSEDEEEEDEEEAEIEEIEDEEVDKKALEKKVAEKIKRIRSKQNGHNKGESEESETDDEMDDAEPISKKPKTETIKADVDSGKENKSPEKKEKTKAQKKKFENVEELIEAVSNHKGGRPKKKEKFENWIKHTFKVDNKKWINDAWMAASK